MPVTFAKQSSPKSPLSPTSPTSGTTSNDPNSRKGSASSYFSGPTSPRLDTITEHIASQSNSAPPSRQGSTASRTGKRFMAGISFGTSQETRKSVEAAAAAAAKKNGDAKVVVGGAKKKPMPMVKGRSKSPPAQAKFHPHVSFDNVASDLEPTEHNPISFTLKEEHIGYHYKRQSRTFMCGINEDAYSDYALQWMLDEMVDDGDEIVCLRVVDRDSKLSNDRGVREKYYQKEARSLMAEVKRRCAGGGKAITITVELAVGKIHTTFMKMIQLHEPGMLIVGTRGRSLGGVQGLINNRNSFSKWCLQYSPIPVVVVRPDDKREKKKHKRLNDPSRRGYADILRDSGVGTHEANIDMGGKDLDPEKGGGVEGVTELLPPRSREEEMHEVAMALALPAKFDPMINKEDLNHRLQTIKSRHRSEGDLSSALSSLNSSPAGSRNASPASKLRNRETRGTDSPVISDIGSDDDDDDEGEFEVTAMGGGGKKDVVAKEQAIEKQHKLHAMEQGEAGALLKGRKGRKGSVASVGSLDSKGSGKDDE